MKKLIALLTAIVLVFAMASSALAIGSQTSTSRTVGNSDGSKSVPKTLSDGTSVVTTTLKDNIGAETKTVVTTTNGVTSIIATASVPSSVGPMKVSLPIPDGVNTTTVAVRVLEDGTEQIVKDCIGTDTGIIVTASGTENFKIIDNAKTFTDIGGWSKASIEFVTSREIFLGYGNDIFAPQENMTRAMLFVVLARFDNADVVTTGENWYDESLAWAVNEGISDGTNPTDNITREQLATILYRYSGSPAVTNDLSAFSDADSVSTWASDAMQWAVKVGLIEGSNGKLMAQDFATREQLAAIIERFCTNVH